MEVHMLRAKNYHVFLAFAPMDLKVRKLKVESETGV